MNCKYEPELRSIPLTFEDCTNQCANNYCLIGACTYKTDKRIRVWCDYNRKNGLCVRGFS